MARLRADLIRQTQRAHNLTVDEHVKDDRTLVPPLVSNGQLLRILLLEHVRATDLHDTSVNAGTHPDSGG